MKLYSGSGKLQLCDFARAGVIAAPESPDWRSIPTAWSWAAAARAAISRRPSPCTPAQTGQRPWQMLRAYPVCRDARRLGFLLPSTNHPATWPGGGSAWLHIPDEPHDARDHPREHPCEKHADEAPHVR